MKIDLQFALRDSEVATRSYVVVNPLLAKHIPSVPSVSLDYFKKLGFMVADTCRNDKVLVIGFAETATAVGIVVASVIENSVYVHTTREKFSHELLLTNFSEDHSHDKNQALFLDKNFADLSQYDRLVFVDDEITTGNTILNLLKNIEFSGKITVSALVFNGFDEKNYSGYEADFCCLQKIGYVETINYDGFLNTHIGVKTNEYIQQCDMLAEWFIRLVDFIEIEDKNILVVGTEEFMYPALVLGKRLEQFSKSVMSHSTTRSPLLINNTPNYPFHLRADFKSIYDTERTTYLYNLDRYDTVIIVTDAADNADGLLDAVRTTKCEKIYLVRVNNAY